MLAEAVGIRYPPFRDYLALFYLDLSAGVALPQTAASFAPTLFMAQDGHPWQKSVGSIVLDRTVEVLVTLLFTVGAAVYLYPVVPSLSVSVIVAGGSTLLALGAAYAWRRRVTQAIDALGTRYPLLRHAAGVSHLPSWAKRREPGSMARKTPPGRGAGDRPRSGEEVRIGPRD